MINPRGNTFHREIFQGPPIVPPLPPWVIVCSPCFCGPGGRFFFDPSVTVKQPSSRFFPPPAGGTTPHRLQSAYGPTGFTRRPQSSSSIAAKPPPKRPARVTVREMSPFLGRRSGPFWMSHGFPKGPDSLAHGRPVFFWVFGPLGFPGGWVCRRWPIGAVPPPTRQMPWPVPLFAFGVPVNGKVP